MKLSPKVKLLLSKLPIRLILSVIAGLAVSTILSMITHETLHLIGLYPPPTKPMFDKHLLLISLIYHSLYAIAGAYVTAQLAKDKAQKAVFILGSKEAIMWVLGILLLWKHNPAWFNIVKAILGIPLAVLGGKIYLWHKNKKEKPVDNY